MSTKITFQHEAQVKEETYKTGDWFLDEDRELCVLVITPKGNCIIYLSEDIKESACARLYGNPFCCDEKHELTQEQFIELVGKEYKKWQRVSVEITTKPFRP